MYFNTLYSNAKNLNTDNPLSFSTEKVCLVTSLKVSRVLVISVTKKNLPVSQLLLMIYSCVLLKLHIYPTNKKNHTNSQKMFLVVIFKN